MKNCYIHNGFPRQNSPAPAALFVATVEYEKPDYCLAAQSETDGELLANLRSNTICRPRKSVGKNPLKGFPFYRCFASRVYFA
jgi:hypothetical protein